MLRLSVQLRIAISEQIAIVIVTCEIICYLFAYKNAFSCALCVGNLFSFPDEVARLIAWNVPAFFTARFFVVRNFYSSKAD